MPSKSVIPLNTLVSPLTAKTLNSCPVASHTYGTHTGSRSRLAIKLFSINCHHTGTFPAVRSLQHPLVIAFVWGHPLSAHAVRGDIPVPLLLRGHCHRLSARRIIILMMKYPWQVSPWWQLLLFLLLSVPLAPGSSQSVQSGGDNPPSTSQTYNVSPLLASHSLTEFGSALLPCFFFSLSFPFSPAHFIPRIGKRCLWAMKSGPVLVWCVSAHLVALVCAGRGGWGSKHTPSSCRAPCFAEARKKKARRGRTRCGNLHVL